MVVLQDLYIRSGEYYYTENEYCLQDVNSFDKVQWKLMVCKTFVDIEKKLRVMCEFDEIESSQIFNFFISHCSVDFIFVSDNFRLLLRKGASY